MSTPVHPRRRSYKAQGRSVTPPSDAPISLQRNTTYHTRKGYNTDILDHATPRRTATCPKSLEDLIADPRQVQVKRLLDTFDKAVSGSSSSLLADADILNDRDVLPIPRFLLDSQVMVGRAQIPPSPPADEEDLMDIDEKLPAVDHTHASDSGLGTSVTESRLGMHTPAPVTGQALACTDTHKDLAGASRSGPRSTVSSSVTSSYTAVTKSVLAIDNGGHFLSDKAQRHIRRNIIEPILKEESLKDFHPLIQDIPRRIGAKSITTLRDLEKTLTFLAPVSTRNGYCSGFTLAHWFSRVIKEFSVTDKSYLSFCTLAIRAVQTTSTVLNDQDLRRPSDAPYTNGYFLNLWDQIHRFAAIIAATREKEAKGEPLDTMDYSRYALTTTRPGGVTLGIRNTDTTSYSDEKIALRGGLSHDGHPLELVREKDGKVIPIGEGSDQVSPYSGKRSLDDEDSEGVLRSMARRRKSDKPGDIEHPCNHPGCDKVFKRNCDLGKHEKTHTRPFKCGDSACKFNSYGFPTEKERDRHENDKHAVNPVMYKCDEPGCPYSSKRESNCKQHKEKAHGWKYIRSKSNGKKKAGDSAPGPSRLSSTPVTPYTPASGHTSSPSVHSFEGFAQPPMHQYQFTPSVGHDDFQTGRRQSATTTGTGASSVYSPITPEEPLLFPHSNLGVDMSTYQWPQQPTPALSTGNAFDDMRINDMTFGGFNTTTGIPHMSPNGQDAVLYSPHDMAMDETLGGDDYQNFTGGDFTLFESTSTAMPPTSFNPNLFQDTGAFGNFSNPLEPLFEGIDQMSHADIDAFLNGLSQH